MHSHLNLDMKILVADRDPISVLLLQDILNTAGFQDHKGATEGALCEELFHTFQPDLLLLDVEALQSENDQSENEKKSSGLQLLQRLHQSLPDDDYRPIIALLSSSQSVFKRQVLQNGATDILAKPFDHTDVLLRVNNLLRTRRLHLRNRAALARK